MQNYLSKAFKIFSISILIYSLSSCKEVFEKDLSNQTVSIIIPQNNLITPLRTVHFKWKEIEGASDYSIEIVSPTFSNISSFNADSTTTNNEIFIDLIPGDYQWRLRANNNSSRTEYSLPFNLKIDTSSNLTNQLVSLISPLDNSISNGISYTFTWSAISEADDYDFILKEGTNWNSSSIVSSDYNMIGVSKTISSLEEKAYIWGVRAKNNIPSLTNYRTRTFYIDTTTPNAPSQLGLPSDNSFFNLNDTVDFTWSLSSDIGGDFKSNITSIIEYSTDSTFSPSLTNKILSPSTSASKVFNIAGTYYWKMYCIDAANNESKFETIKRSFTIQ